MLQTAREIEILWLDLKDQLKQLLEPQEVKVWIEPLTLLEEGPDQLALACPNSFHRKWVNDNYFGKIRELATQANPACQLRLVIGRKNPAKTQAAGQVRQLPLPNLQSPPPQLNRRFVFERFIRGQSNEFAYAAAKSLAEEQNGLSNTLFLVSGTGLGKSHLTQAVGHQVFCRSGGQRVAYLTAEDFASQLYSAIRSKRMDQFKDSFRRHCDLLLLEGVQFLAGKDKTQDELIYTLDALLNAGKRVVFTGDVAPTRIKGLKYELASRLACGMTAPIEPPDHPTRVRILSAMASEEGHLIDPAVLEYLADQVTGDVRRLNSALVSLLAKSSLTGRPMDLGLAGEVVGQFALRKSRITAGQIRDLAAKVYNLSREEITGKSRRQVVTRPRNLAMFLARKHTNSSYASIGKLFNRDHSTVMYGVGQIDRQLNTDPRLGQELAYLEQQLGVN